MLVIVTSHYNEDLNWLKQSKWPVVVVDKEGADPTDLPVQYTIPNKGFETSSYLKYIVENYDNLPDHIAFLHGHETAWHQFHDRGLLELIEAARIDKYGYIPLCNFMGWYAFAHPSDVEEDRMDMVTSWEKFGFPERLKPPHYFMFRIPLGAQFIVAKERILAHPKQDWQRWFELVDSKNGSVFFEHIFHVLLGEFWRCELHDDWFNFEPAKLVWCHEIAGLPEAIDYYAEGLFKSVTLEQVNEKLKGHGWHWN